MTGDEVVHIEKVSKRYLMGSVEVHALREVDLSIKTGEFVAVMGPSGSGKSTLMNIIGLLDRPDGGYYRLQGQDVSQADDDQRSDLRSRFIGFIFQNFNLLPRVTADRNVALPFAYRRDKKFDIEAKCHSALQAMGVAERAGHLPSQLSGGERQRVAIARALAGDPALILADEPTGNLDQTTGDEIIRLLRHIADEGRTIIMVTHDPRLAAATDRIVRMMDGWIKS